MNIIDETNGIWAYCPQCDVQHILEAHVSGSHHCPFGNVFIIQEGTYMGIGIHERGLCTCPIHFRLFGDEPSTCEYCGLLIKILHHDLIMSKFIKGMWKQVRGYLDTLQQTSNYLRNTFPRRFAEIVAESDAINAVALAPHLPPVLIGIVAEYFG